MKNKNDETSDLIEQMKGEIEVFLDAEFGRGNRNKITSATEKIIQIIEKHINK